MVRAMPHMPDSDADPNQDLIKMLHPDPNPD
jgi:hypothetical protein